MIQFLLFICLATILAMARNTIASIIDGWFAFRRANPPQEDIIDTNFNFVTAKFKFTETNYYTIRLGQNGIHIAPTLVNRSPHLWGFAFVSWKDLIYDGPSFPINDCGEIVWSQFTQASTQLTFSLAGTVSLAVKNHVITNRMPSEPFIS